MKALKISLLILAGIVALFFLITALLPATYQVERKITIAAPLEVVYENIVSLENWEAWDPWMVQEPTAPNTYEGTRGIGQKRCWNGKVLGKGCMTIYDAVELETMYFNLVFLEPYEMHSSGVFTLNTVNEGIEVTWQMYGNLTYPFERLIGLTMDSSLGTDFENGLKQLKILCEKEAGAVPEIFSSEISSEDAADE